MKSLPALTGLFVAIYVVLGVGCTGQPLLSDTFGLLPGPASDLLQQASLSGQISDALQSGGFDLSDLADLAGSGQDQTGDDTDTDDTTDDTTDDDTDDQGEEQDCPDGQVWVGTVEVNGQTMAINACVDESLARQYGVN